MSQLNGSVQLTETVQLISLKAGRLRTVNKCITVGWGDIGDNNTLALTLQEVNVTILSDQTCRSRWGMVPIFSSMVCGVGEGVFQGFCSVRIHIVKHETLNERTPLLPKRCDLLLRGIQADRWCVMAPQQAWSPSLAGDVETLGLLMSTHARHPSRRGSQLC